MRCYQNDICAWMRVQATLPFSGRPGTGKRICGTHAPHPLPAAFRRRAATVASCSLLPSELARCVTTQLPGC